MAGMDKRVIGGIVLICAVILGFGVWIGSRSGRSDDGSPAAEEQTSVETKLTAKDWVKGKAEAPITLMEYGDFQCPACGAYYPLVERLMSEYPDRVRVVYREYPLVSIHDKAYAAALAAEAAGRQGRFWEMYDKLFVNQKTWTATTDYESLFTKYAQEIGLDVERWKSDRTDKGMEEKIQGDRLSGDSLGVTSTPTFFLNGTLLPLPGSYENLKKAVESVAESITPVPVEKVHMHFDIAVYRDGRKLDLAADKYMEKNEAVHFHDGNGEVAHIHEKEATVGMLVDSLGVDEAGAAGMVVNGKSYEGDWKRYMPADLDRIVVMYGRQMASPQVTDKACIYSETCPERGKPPSEECVGGLDTPCE